MNMQIYLIWFTNEYFLPDAGGEALQTQLQVPCLTGWKRKKAVISMHIV